MRIGIDLFVMLLLVTILVEGVNANPIYLGEAAPDPYTNPPSIIILSPQNNSYYNITDIPLSLRVSVGESKTATYCAIDTITYMADWKSGIFTIYTTEMFKEQLSRNQSHNPINYFSETFNITDVPAGNHLITISATERGTYSNASQQMPSPYESLSPYHSFAIKNSASVSFSTFKLTTSTDEPTESSQGNQPEEINYYLVSLNCSCCCNHNSGCCFSFCDLLLEKK